MAVVTAYCHSPESQRAQCGMEVTTFHQRRVRSEIGTSISCPPLPSTCLLRGSAGRGPVYGTLGTSIHSSGLLLRRLRVGFLGAGPLRGMSVFRSTKPVR